MISIFKRLVSLLLISTLLVGCAGAPGSTYQSSNGNSCPFFGEKAMVGALGGAAVGAAAGASLNHDNALAGALAGALIGAIAAGFAGAALDHNDCDKAEVAFNKMSKAKTGEAIAWNNPKSGNSGKVVPLSKPKKMANNQVCRKYSSTVQLKDGRTIEETGTTCRQPNGDWVTKPDVA